MSDIFQGVFGGSKSQNTGASTSQNSSQNQSSNLAYPMLSQALGGQLGNGGAANNQLANMLGLNGAAGQQQGFDNFRNSTGYQFGLDQGTQAITQNAATKGLLNSGSTARGVDTFGQNYANSQYQNYTNMLSGLTGQGNQAGSVISSAGGQSTGSSSGTSKSASSGSGSSKPGIGGFLGSIL